MGVLENGDAATVLGGGSIVIHEVKGKKTGVVTNAVNEESITFNVMAYPNPSEQYFNLNVQSGSQETIDLKVFDMHGRVVYTTRGSANQSYRFGDKFVAGVYMVEVRQGENRSIIQVVKQ